MITNCIVLLVNTLEGSWVEKERQHSPSNTYLSTCPSGQPTSFLCSQKFLDQKCAKFGFELNDTIGRSLMNIKQAKCPEV